MHGIPGAQCSEIPVLGLPLQNEMLAGLMQEFGINRSQKNPAAQEPAPGQHTPPIGAQLNLLGQRKCPGLPGHGGPEVAVRCVPDGMTTVVPGRIVTNSVTLEPSRGGAGATPGPGGTLRAARAANATQSADPSASVAFRM